MRYPQHRSRLSHAPPTIAQPRHPARYYLEPSELLLESLQHHLIQESVGGPEDTNPTAIHIETDLGKSNVEPALAPAIYTGDVINIDDESDDDTRSEQADPRDMQQALQIMGRIIRDGCIYKHERLIVENAANGHGNDIDIMAQLTTNSILRHGMHTLRL